MMRIYHNYIPASHYRMRKISNLIPEQSLGETVSVYEDAIPYIKCQIQSTIQHEAGHREDESGRQQEISSGKQVTDFQDFTSESRAEPIAEKEEENCEMLTPQELGGNVVSINLNQLFEEVKAVSKINPAFKQDIRAGTLAPEAQGMYLMQEFPSDPSTTIKSQKSNEVYEGFDGSLWIDVRKIIEPFLAHGQQMSQNTKPPTYQDDGMISDVPNVSQMPPSPGAVSASPFVPSVPAIGAR